MIKTLLAVCCFATVLFACKTSPKRTRLLQPSNLPSQHFFVNTNNDTSLLTLNGAVIRIPAGAIVSEGNEMAELEIKEAYTITQIMQAGLTTTSDGQPLSSGGMIYIDAITGHKIKIAKPIAISVPTAFINGKMKLFQGEKDKAGNINWKDPKPLPLNPVKEQFEKGKTLFNTNCASCHSLDKDAAGPQLSYIASRTGNKKLLYAYTRNNMNIMGTEGNIYYQCLYEKWNKTPMPVYPALTNDELDNLYAYIENESKVRDLPLVKNELKACIDSCRKYRDIKYALYNAKEKLTSAAVRLVIDSIVNPPVNSPTPAGMSNPIAGDLSNYVQIENSKSLYYQFTITETGWYNIDMLMKDANAVESSVVVNITGAYKSEINVYLVLPAAKVFLQGGFLQGKTDQFGFSTNDGKMPLPQQSTAIVFAIGEFEDKIVYAKKVFTTNTAQQLDLQLAITKKESFNVSVKEMGLTDFNIRINDTQIADTLRKVIHEIKDVEKIKPVSCNCDCIMPPRSMPVTDNSIQYERK